MASSQTILFLGANPQDTSRLRLDQELRDIGEGLQRSQQRDRFNLEQKWAVRPRDIQRAMLDLQPQIVHFSGHGDGEAGLVFEDEVGKSKLVDGAALAGLFELFADQLHCVVLNGCYSEVQAKAISQHIPYVIGMNKAIGDNTAIAFAVGFYDALGAGRDVEFAYKLGCAAIRMEGIAEHLTPVLLKKIIPETIKPLEITPIPMTPSNSPVSAAPVDVFIAYSRKDDDLRSKLVTHLSLLKRQGKIAAWYDGDIEIGSEWEVQLQDRLDSSPIILLLISADFLASEYCYETEMKRAIERHQAKTALVIPILLRPCDWQGSPFSALQGLPKDLKPVTLWSDQDSAFLDIAQGIRKALDSVHARLQSKSPNPAKVSAANSSAENHPPAEQVKMNQVNSGESTGVQNHTSGGVTYIADKINIINGGFHQPGWKVNTVNQVQGDLNISESHNPEQVKDERASDS
jgi:TIR domain/CHAT domain